MTDPAAKYIVEHPEEFGDIGPLGWSQVHHAKGFLEGLQAGRAEMAEELVAYVLDTPLYFELESHRHGLVGDIRKLAQRDGGKNV